MSDASVLSELVGETVLVNDRVHVQRFVLRPGQSVGTYANPNGELLIYIHGGTLADARGRVTIWRDGRVCWFDGSDSLREAGTNVGANNIEMVVISFQPVAVGVVRPCPPVAPLSYPNIAGEDLLENEVVIVQRFTIDPGQWEGVHAHQPNMLFIHIRGGHWAARTAGGPAQPYPQPSADGEVGWMDPVDISVGHESGNIGSNPIDFIWVSLRQ